MFMADIMLYLMILAGLGLSVLYIHGALKTRRSVRMRNGAGSHLTPPASPMDWHVASPAARASWGGRRRIALTLKNEDHWLSHVATWLQMLHAIMDFLRNNNPPW